MTIIKWAGGKGKLECAWKVLGGREVEGRWAESRLRWRDKVYRERRKVMGDLRTF